MRVAVVALRKAWRESMVVLKTGSDSLTRRPVRAGALGLAVPDAPDCAASNSTACLPLPATASTIGHGAVPADRFDSDRSGIHGGVTP